MNSNKKGNRMGRLGRKKCDICNRGIDPLGNMRLADGCMCTECAKLISPLLKNRKSATVEYMKRHIAYRKENEKRLSAFDCVARYGYDKKIYIDPKKGAFLVTRKLEKDIAIGNPDIISLADVVSCDTKIRKHSVKESDYYDFIVTVKLDSEWFDEVVVNLNGDSIESKDSRMYRKCESDAKELKDTLIVDQSFMASLPPIGDRKIFRL